MRTFEIRNPRTVSQEKPVATIEADYFYETEAGIVFMVGEETGTASTPAKNAVGFAPGGFIVKEKK